MCGECSSSCIKCGCVLTVNSSKAYLSVRAWPAKLKNEPVTLQESGCLKCTTFWHLWALLLQPTFFSALAFFLCVLLLFYSGPAPCPTAPRVYRGGGSQQLVQDPSAWPVWPQLLSRCGSVVEFSGPSAWVTAHHKEWVKRPKLQGGMDCKVLRRWIKFHPVASHPCFNAETSGTNRRDSESQELTINQTLIQFTYECHASSLRSFFPWFSQSEHISVLYWD